MHRARWLAAFASVGLLGLAAGAPAPAQAPPGQKWGTSVKGKVEWAGGAVPAPRVIAVPAPVPACIPPGGLLSDELVVDPKTKGVRWAFVWLIDEGKDFKKPL